MQRVSKTSESTKSTYYDISKDVLIHLSAKNGLPERIVSPSLNYVYDNHYYSRSFKSENFDEVKNGEKMESFENIAVTKKNSRKFLLGTKVYLNRASMNYDNNIMKYGTNFKSNDNVNFYGYGKLSLCDRKENETTYIIPPSFDNFKICAPIVVIGVGSQKILERVRIHKLTFNVTGRSELKQYNDYVKYCLAIHASNLKKQELLGTKLPYTLASHIFKLKNVKTLEEMNVKLCSHFSNDPSLLFASYRFMYVERKTYELHDIRDYDENELIRGFNLRTKEKNEIKFTFFTKFTRSLEEINNKQITLQTMIPICKDNRYSPHILRVPCEHCRPASYEAFKKNVEKKEKNLKKNETQETQEELSEIEQDYDTTSISHKAAIGNMEHKMMTYADILALPAKSNVSEVQMVIDDDISRDYDEAM